MWKFVLEFNATEDCSKQKVKQDANGKREHEDKSREGRGRSIFDKTNKGRTKPKVSSSQLTPLNRSQEEILSQNKDLLHPPTHLQALPSKTDRSKWCDLHNDHGHHIESYKDLMHEIDDCIK